MSTEPTKSDLHLPDWSICDRVTHFREWASDKLHLLPTAPPAPYQGEWFIGTSARCVIRLHDPSGRVSRTHARLLHEQGRWGLLDVGSRNGTRIDGSRQVIGYLGPGAEAQLGGVTLVAESPQLVTLRRFLCRLLGWAPERAEAVDLALRAVRLAQVRRTPLVLRGDGELVQVARHLHARVFPAGAPFVLCSSRGPSVAANLLDGDALDAQLAALRGAHRGSICVHASLRPRDELQLLSTLRDPSCCAQLIVCDDAIDRTETLLDHPITIPSVADRGGELMRVVEECCEDAAAAFGTATFDGPSDRAWLLRHSAGSMSQILEGADRLATLRASESVERAAAPLGMTYQALRDWFDAKGAGGA